jgi:hypothetical protein
VSREEFIKVLDSKGYSYEIEGDRIVVTHKGQLLTGITLRFLTSLPSGVEFRNKGDIFLDALTSLPLGVEFKNGGTVRLKSLLGGYSDEWNGNIEGINNKRLLNKMIKKGVFER